MYAAYKVLRTVAFIIAFFLAVMFLIVVWPVSFLNPLLRRLGFHHYQLPSNKAYQFAAAATLRVGGFKVHLNRSESNKEALRLLERGPCIVMYTHASNLDPLVVMVVARCAPKFIFKKELLRVPLFGWVLWLYGQIAIDRKNREQAVASLDEAVKTLTSCGQSIAIAPEGTRSRTGELQDFKRGPFHLAQKSGAMCVPLVIRGAFELLPPRSKFFDAGDITVTALEPVRGDSVDELSAKVHAAVEGELRKRKEQEAATRDEATKRRRQFNKTLGSTLPAFGLYAAMSVAALLIKSWC
jgi:1-acyl-sn-glycerol-3-phosphate acyltransferase